MKRALTIALICLLPVLVSAQVLVDFDTDSLENWRSEGDGRYYLEPLTGNPGNCMRIDDDATGDLNIAIAPVAFLGDWSMADSTDSLFCDVHVTRIDGSVLASSWVFRISGPGGMATGLFVTVVYDQWQHFSIALDSSQWQMNQGTWSGLMRHVNLLEVRAEYVYGDEYVRLDNIGLSFTPQVVPVVPPVYTEFEKGTFEGWTFEQSGGAAIQSSGGNPGGCCKVTDGTGISQAIAPPSFLGDWRQLDGNAAIQFDLKITGFSGSLLLSDYLIKLSGPGGEAVIPMDSTIMNTYNEWNTFSYMISENQWMVLSGGWDALLDNVLEVRIIAEYINGSETVWLDNIRISNNRPAADFDADPVFVFAGDAVQFTDRSRFAPDGWEWTFGDGGASSEQSPLHVYEEAGLFDVQLICSNYFGLDTLKKAGCIEVAGLTDSILFEDNFDDNDIHPAWYFRNGTWVEQGGTMVQNSNYYNGGYIGGAYALVGSSYWKNYKLSVGFRSTDNDKIGVVFNYVDDKNFYLYTWQQEGTIRALKKFTDGVETNLDVDTLGYVMNTWYHLELTTDNGSLSGIIDSVEVFSITDSTFLSGRAGLYCHGNQNSYWDNFRIVNLDYVNSVDKKTGPEPVRDFILLQNYPNPFNPVTAIAFTLPEAADVELRIYNTLGKEVAMVVSQKLNRGHHTFRFDGSSLASGVYYYRLVAGDILQVRKMVLVK